MVRSVADRTFQPCDVPALAAVCGEADGEALESQGHVGALKLEERPDLAHPGQADDGVLAWTGVAVLVDAQLCRDRLEHPWLIWG